MKISNNILIGVNIKRYADFYNHIVLYNDILNKNFKELENHELIGLVINHDKENVYEYYYTKYNNVVFLLLSITNIKSKYTEWSSIDKTSDELMFENIRSHKYIFDVEYYIKNT